MVPGITRLILSVLLVLFSLLNFLPGGQLSTYLVLQFLGYVTTNRINQ